MYCLFSFSYSYIGSGIHLKTFFLSYSLLRKCPLTTEHELVI
jgi:hypothetical protein